MKKINLIVFTVLMFILFSINTYALNTPNGVVIEGDSNDGTINLYCSYYNGDYVKIERSPLSTDQGYVSPSNLPFQIATDYTLKAHDFMNSEGLVDCPSYIFGEASPTGGKLQTINGFSNRMLSGTSYVFVELNGGESFCTGNCQGITKRDNWSCEYTGREGTLTTKYDGLYLIYYPDRSVNEVDSATISQSCEDIYYNRVTKEIKYSTTKNSSNNNQYLCDNRNDIDYYCSGDCKFPDNAKIDCYDLDTNTHPTTGEDRNPMYEDGNLSEICAEERVQNSLKFVGYLLYIVKVAIPGLLILFGAIDFAKVVVTSKQDTLSKSAMSFVRRIIIGIVIFLIPTVVNYVFELVGHGNTSYNECRICVFSPSLCGKGR